MQKIGFSLQSSYSMPLPEVVKLLGAIGVTAVSPVRPRDGSLKELVCSAEHRGLQLQSLHGPVWGLDAMWSRDRDRSAPILQDVLSAIEDCATYDFPVLVIHSWGGLHYTFREEDLFFDHFDTVVEYAQRAGIQIAFENLEGPEYLTALMTRYAGLDTVGLCWDSGHELCYTPNQDALAAYGNRLLITHLNDNFGITHPEGLLQGTDDLHLLPGDGIALWPQIVCRLRQARQQEILNFELKIRPKGDRCKTDLYSHIPLEQYLTQAYQQASQAVSGYFE